MPKLFGLNLVSVILATVVFWAVGFLWYGVLFQAPWMAAEGFTEADLEGSSPVWMAVGVVISLLSVVVIGKVLQWTNAASIGDAIQRTVILWIGFGVTMALYGLAYTPSHSMALFMIDAGHLLVGWAAAATVLAMMK